MLDWCRDCGNALLSKKSNATVHGGRKMKTQIDSDGAATVHKSAANRHASELQAQAGPGSRRFRALLRRGQRGSALVEFALILPALLLITTGVMIFGVAMNNYLQLTNAVSVGARSVSTYAGQTLDPCAVASNAVIAAAPGLNSSLLTFSYTFNGIPQTGTTCASGTLTTGAAANLASGSTVTVTAKYPFNLSVYGQVFSKNNAVLQATSAELVQ
jgi:Flp pilus assembly protein TadG